MTASRQPLSLMGQAEFLDYLLRRCEMRSGSVSAETWMRLDSNEVADLRHLEQRLRRMARHEAKIKEIVTRG